MSLKLTMDQLPPDVFQATGEKALLCQPVDVWMIKMNRNGIYATLLPAQLWNTKEFRHLFSKK